MTFSVGTRVQVQSSGAFATVVHRYDPLFVDIDYDEPQPTHFADGTPTTTTCSCIHVGLLIPAGTTPLFDLDDPPGRKASR